MKLRHKQRRPAHLDAAHLGAALVVLGLLAGSCTAGSGRPAASTTTNPTTTTLLRPTTTLASTGDGAFGTRVKDVLTVGVTGNRPPFMVHKQFRVEGLEYDVVRAVASRLDVSLVQMVPASMVQMAAGLDCGCDLFIGGVEAGRELARVVDLSVAYLPAPPVGLVRVKGPRVTLTTVPTLRWGYLFEDDPARRTIEGQVRPTKPPSGFLSRRDALTALARSQIDVFMTNLPEALVVSRADKRFAVTGRFNVAAGMSIVLPLGSPNTPSLNDILTSLRDDGTLDFVARRWLGPQFDTVPLLPEK